jgi:uncharacterized protein
MTPSYSRNGVTAQARLVEALRASAVSTIGELNVSLIETHISFVLLAGEFAYKIKKAVDLGFLDFRRFAARRFYCTEELRLNRRLAPNLYVDVVAITGTIEAPRLGGNGRAIEYAVRMRRFPPNALASEELARGELSAADVDVLAAKIAEFHRVVPVADSHAYGTPEDVLRVARLNFTQIRSLPDSHGEADTLAALAKWTTREYGACKEAIGRRRDGGFVRECHGDLHLGNIARFEGDLTVFDCIEFNEAMRWIDVMSEIAFTTMDLRARCRPDLAHRFLNAYLEITGDYDGLSVLRFYCVYRALVRAKVTALHAAQVAAGEAKATLLAEYRTYLNLAAHYATPTRGAIVITHGVSGTGKTTRSQYLLELAGAVRIRTDVERKRQDRVDTVQPVSSCIEGGLYTPQATAWTYATARAHARSVVKAGYIAIVDAAFLKRWQRDLFRNLGTELAVPFVVVAFTASGATLHQRILHRLKAGDDASEATLAVLEHQLRTMDPLSASELADAVIYDAETPLGQTRSPEYWRAVLHRLGADTAARHAAREPLSSRA